MRAGLRVLFFTVACSVAAFQTGCYSKEKSPNNLSTNATNQTLLDTNVNVDWQLSSAGYSAHVLVEWNPEDAEIPVNSIELYTGVIDEFTMFNCSKSMLRQMNQSVIPLTEEQFESGALSLTFYFTIEDIFSSPVPANAQVEPVIGFAYQGGAPNHGRTGALSLDMRYEIDTLEAPLVVDSVHTCTVIPDSGDSREKDLTQNPFSIFGSGGTQLK